MPAKHSGESPSGLVSELLEQAKIDIGSDVRIPGITPDEIILLSHSEDEQRDLDLLIIGDDLHRIEPYIRIAVGDQDDDSRLVGLLIGELLEIPYAEQERITDSRSEEILDRGKIAEIHRAQFGDDSR